MPQCWLLNSQVLSQKKKYLSNDNKLSQKMIIIILIVNKISATTGHCGLFVAQGNINIHIPAQT